MISRVLKYWRGAGSRLILHVGRLAIGVSHDSYHSMLTSDNHFENY
jgi:hypothetical protein